MAIDPQNRQNIDDTSVYIQDTLLSISANIGEALRSAVEDAFDGADATVIKSVGTDLTRSFRSMAKFSDDTASNSLKISKGLVSSRDITKQLEQLEIKRSALARKIMLARRVGAEINLEDLESTNKALKAQQEQLEADQTRANNMEKNMGIMGELFTRFSKNKFFGSLLNAEEGLKAMRVAADKGTKGFALMGKGISAAFSGLEKASVILFLVNGVVKAARFIVSLFTAADENATMIAKNLGVSKENAEVIRKEFVKISGASTNILATSKALAEAQSDLVKFSGAVTIESFKQAEAQVLLTKNLGIAGDNAAMFQAVLGTAGDSMSNMIEKTRVLADEQFNTNGFFISNQDILKDIANTSAEIVGYYGFSADNLAKAAFQTRKFGLSLQQAKNISEGLLNFEQSISSELELELLTGKQFNLERARTLALTGDIAGATEQVMKEMSKMTEAQRRSPILMKSFSELTGLSADELNRAYLVQTTLNQSTKDYIKLLEKEGKLEQAKLAEELGLQGLTEDQIKKNLSSQEKFNAALEKAKDQFTGLVDSGAIDKLSNLLIDFVNRASKVGIFRAMIGGPGASVKLGQSVQAAVGDSFTFQDKYKQDKAGTIQALQKAIDDRRRLGDLDQAGVSMLANQYGDAVIEEALKGLSERLSKSGNAIDRAAGKIYGEYRVRGTQINAEDFTIKTHPKDTLVMAGGTGLSDNKETTKLLEKLIMAVEEGKIINLDGRKVNEGLAMSYTKFN